MNSFKVEGAGERKENWWGQPHVQAEGQSPEVDASPRAAGEKAGPMGPAEGRRGGKKQEAESLLTLELGWGVGEV